mgnify:CR=1 FL=1
MAIPKTMKALVAYGKDAYRLETDYPTPVCGPDDIIIKTEACGICAGDLKCSHGAAMFWGDEVQPAWVKPPFIPGHEFFGRIVEMGENVTGFRLGDRITADQIVPCGKCRFCKTGRYWMCQPHNIFGFQSTNNGGMAEYVRYPKESVISRVPEEMSLEDALLIEPYGCSKHCVDRAQITNEDVVVISGAGTLGLGMITYARMKNPKLLIEQLIIQSHSPKSKCFLFKFLLPINAFQYISRKITSYKCLSGYHTGNCTVAGNIAMISFSLSSDSQFSTISLSVKSFFVFNHISETVSVAFNNSHEIRIISDNNVYLLG